MYHSFSNWLLFLTAVCQSTMDNFFSTNARWLKLEFMPYNTQKKVVYLKAMFKLNNYKFIILTNLP